MGLQVFSFCGVDLSWGWGEADKESIALDAVLLLLRFVSSNTRLLG